MCNLYTLRATANQIADAFAAERPASINGGGEDLCLGSPGVVMRGRFGFCMHTTNILPRLRFNKPENAEN